MNEMIRSPLQGRAVEIPLVVQQEFNKVKNVWSPYGPTIRVTQQSIDIFTSLTGDENPIHKASAQVSVVPGFLTLALMPKLLGHKLPMQIPGHQLFNAAVSIRFVRTVAVGAGICMRYQGKMLWGDRMNVRAQFDFEIILIETRKHVVEGQIELCLV